MKLPLFLLSLSLGFYLCSCDGCDEMSHELTQLPSSIAPCPPSTRPPKFDHFILTLTWPNAFCKLHGVTCKPFPADQQYFTIHGLWPENQYHNAAENCREEDGRQLTEAILDRRKRNLLKYWPRLYSPKEFKKSKKLWRDQWCKHGSCSSNVFSPADYFDKAIALASRYSPLIMDKLKAAGITANGDKYSWEKIVTAVSSAVGNVNVRLSCEEDTSNNLQLTEIQICVNSNAETLNNCNRQTVAKCQTDLVFASPDRLPPPPTLPLRSLVTPFFVPSILEVEEAAGRQMYE